MRGRRPNPEPIQATVRQPYGRFRLCYEQGLRGCPNLEGKINIRLVIGLGGRVIKAKDGGSDLADYSVVERSPSISQIHSLDLRGSQLGVSFKRQVPLGGRFIVDFLASTAKLVVEVDGPYHGGRALADARRDGALARLGYKVLRLDAGLVVRDMASALALVRAALEAGR